MTVVLTSWRWRVQLQCWLWPLSKTCLLDYSGQLITEPFERRYSRAQACHGSARLRWRYCRVPFRTLSRARALSMTANENGQNIVSLRYFSIWIHSFKSMSLKLCLWLLKRLVKSWASEAKIQRSHSFSTTSENAENLPRAKCHLWKRTLIAKRTSLKYQSELKTTCVKFRYVFISILRCFSNILYCAQNDSCSSFTIPYKLKQYFE